MKHPKLTTVNGYDYVRIHGKTHYLGRHGKAETKQKYLAALADPDGFIRTKNPQTITTVKQVCVMYLKERAKRSHDSHKHKFNTVTDSLIATFPGIDVDTLTYRDMVRYRDYLVSTPTPNGTQRSRNHVNSLLTATKAVFCFGKKMGYIGAETLVSVEQIERLKPGESKAVETEERRPVPQKDIDGTLPYCSPMIADMIRLSTLMGTRPGELESMTFDQIFQDEEEPTLFIYKPRRHKNSHRGQLREIPIFTESKAIIDKYLPYRQPNEPIFQNQKGKQLSSAGYRYHVKTAIQASQADGKDVAHWFPYQLRHNCFSDVCRKHGFNVASVWCGHKSGKVGDRYNHSGRDILRDVARRTKKTQTQSPTVFDTDAIAAKDAEIAVLKATLATILQMQTSSDSKPELRVIG